LLESGESVDQSVADTNNTLASKEIATSPVADNNALPFWQKKGGPKDGPARFFEA
jgi:hypothetical protein